MIKKIIKTTTHAKQAMDDRKFWQSQTSEYRLNAVEKLRIEVGNFLYEYPARLQRTIRVSTSRTRDKADVEELS